MASTSSKSLDEAAAMLQEAALASKRRRSMAIAGEVPSFVRTVYTLLGVCDDAVIRWSKDGRQVIIADPERFGAEICPKFFRHKNVHSFTRLLNMYQFRKVSSSGGAGPQALIFEHAHFIRGREDLLPRVQRKGTRAGDDHPRAAAAADEATPANLDAALQPIHGTTGLHGDQTDKILTLEAQLKELRAENDRLKDLEKQRDQLRTEIQSQQDMLAALLDIPADPAPVKDPEPAAETVDPNAALLPLLQMCMAGMAAAAARPQQQPPQQPPFADVVFPHDPPAPMNPNDALNAANLAFAAAMAAVQQQPPTTPTLETHVRRQPDAADFGEPCAKKQRLTVL